MKNLLKGAALIIFVLVLAMTTFAEDEVLIIDNPGFELGTEGWSNINGQINPVGSFEITSSKHYEGNYSAKVSKPTSEGKMGIFSAGSFGVNEYRWYVAEAMFYTEDSTLTPELYIEFYDMNSSKNAQYKVSGTAGKGEWEKLTVTAIAPQGAVMARIVPYISEGSTGTMYVDCVSLVKKPILGNSTFDNNIDGWAASSGSISHENGKLKVAAGKAYTNPHYAASGVEQVFSGTVSDISGGKAYASLVFLSSGNEVNKIRTEITDGTFSVRGYTPIGVTTMNVYLEAEGTACFDDLLLTPANKGTQVPDGSFEAMGQNNSSPWTSEIVAIETETFPGGDFDENAWTISHMHTYGGYTSDQKVSGNRSAWFTTINSGGLRSPLIPVTVGMKYTAKMKYLSPNSDMQFYIEFWSDGPVDASASKRIGVNLVKPTASATWADAEVSNTAPSGAKYMTVLIYYSSNWGVERTAYTDDISITDKDGNVVFSEGFETNTTAGSDWAMTNSSRGSFIRNVANKYSTNMALTITTNGTGGVGARSPVMPAVAGKEYTASAKYITANSTLYVYLEFWTDDKLTTRLNEDRVNLAPSSSWAESKITRKAPAGTKYVTVLYYFLQTDGGAVGYIDEVTLTSAGSGITYETMTADALTDGSYSLVLENTSTSTVHNIPVLMGKDYVTVADVKSNTEGGATMTLTFCDWLGNDLESKTVSSEGTGKERLAIDTMAPLNAFSVKIKLTSLGRTAFDNVQIYSVADTIANPSFENTDFRYSGKHSTQWQSIGEIAALTYGDKNIENPDGTFALEIYGTGDEGALRSNMIRIDEHEDYTARMMAKGNCTGLRIVFFDGSFDLIYEGMPETIDSNDWERFAVSETAPEGAKYACVEVLAEHGDYVIVDACEFFTTVANIGNKHQLFIDDYIISEQSGIKKTFHQGEKSSPVIEPSPELVNEIDGVYVYGTVLYDEDEKIYKMWYATHDSQSVPGVGVVMACYATSKDGVNWEKPNLGLVSYNGSTNNNIIGDYHLQSVFKDYETTDPAKKYKMVTYDLNGNYATYYSPDGLVWTKDINILPYADVITAAKDNTNNQFVAIAKINLIKRNQFTLTSPDFENWSTPVMSNTLADLMDSRLCYRADSYGMGLYERDGVFIGFNWLFIMPGNWAAEGVIEPRLAFSRDLTDEWQRPTRMPLIPLGPKGSSDDGMIFTTSYATEMGDEVWVYCGGWDGDHGIPQRSCNIYIAKWRLDGFASLDSGAREGTVITRQFTFDGKELFINANAEGGRIYAELLDEHGRPIDGFTKEECNVLTTDSVKHSVSWNGNKDVSSLSGQVVSLKLYCENSEVYSFAFGESTTESKDKATLTLFETNLTAESEVDATLFIATYDDETGKMTDIITTPLTAGVSATVTVSEGQKAFVLDDKMIPLCEMLTVKYDSV